MAEILFQGHGSYRIKSNSDMVIYVDPFAGKGYDVPADIILVTHEHSDHNQVSLVTKKPDCRIIRASDMLKNGQYSTFEASGVKIEAVQAYNRNHRKDECVGYIISLDGVTVYAAGDTSRTDQMRELKDRKLTWAFLPIDGIYNMDAAEASECAKLIGAAHTVPIHMKPGDLFDLKAAETFRAPGRVILKPGETVEL